MTETTQHRAPEIRRAPGIDLYFAYVGVITLVYGLLLVTHMAREWILSEWLINYQGGFVRRGLPGEAAYLLGRVTHVSPAAFVVVFCLALYAILFACMRNLTVRAPKGLWVLALILSPATLSFQILDVLAGFHKEILYLASLALFAVLLQRKKLSATGEVAYLTVVILAAVFSHEPLVFFILYFFALLMLAGRTFAQAAYRCVLPFGLGLAGVLLCARHLGNAAVATQICASLGYKFVPSVLASSNQICSGGAIAYLQYTSAMALAEVRTKVGLDHYFALYPVLVLLALAPAIAGTRAIARLGLRRKLRIVWYTAALSFVGSLTLFVYGADWGRWIYIHVVSIAILMLFLGDLARERSLRVPVAPPDPLSRRRKAAYGVVLVLYSTCWTLPHFNESSPHFGYIDLVRSMVAFPQRYAESKRKEAVLAAPAEGVRTLKR